MWHVHSNFNPVIKENDMKSITQLHSLVRNSAALPALLASLALTLLMPGIANAQDVGDGGAKRGHATRYADVSDASLVKSLPGFKNGYAEVNGELVIAG